MPWISALTRIPWRLLVDHAPTIVGAASRVYAGARPPRERPETGDTAPSDRESIQRIVERLEARDVQQATVLADLAKQVHDMTTALEVLRARARWAWITAALALAMALATALFLGR